jgi:hypothetical protein
MPRHFHHGLLDHETAMLLDLLYLAVGTGALVACWAFVEACDRL